MVICSFQVNRDMFYLKEEKEKVFGLEVPYFSEINTFIYLANYT